MRLQRCSVRLLAFSLLAACVAGRDLISNDYLNDPKGIDVVKHMFDKFHKDFNGGDQRCVESENWSEEVLIQVNVDGSKSRMEIYYLTTPENVRLDLVVYRDDLDEDEARVMLFCTKNGLKAAEEFVSAASDLSLKHIDIMVRPVRAGADFESELEKLVTDLPKKKVSQKYSFDKGTKKSTIKLDENGDVEIRKQGTYFSQSVVKFWLKNGSSALKNDSVFMMYNNKLHFVNYNQLPLFFVTLFTTFEVTSSFEVLNPVDGKFPRSPFDLSSDVKPPGVSIRKHSNASTPGHTSTARRVAGDSTDRIDRVIFDLSHDSFMPKHGRDGSFELVELGEDFLMRKRQQHFAGHTAVLNHFFEID